MKLADIKKIKWEQLVNRNETLLCRSVHDRSVNEKKALGFTIPEGYIARLITGEVIHPSPWIKAVRAHFSEDWKNIYVFRKRLVKYVKAYEQAAMVVEKTDVKKLSQRELHKVLSEFLRAAMMGATFLSPLAAADKVLSGAISDLLSVPENQKQKVLSILPFPYKENSHTLEERDFLNLVKAYRQNSRNFKKLLNNHLKKYSWIGARGYRWDLIWTEKDIEKRIEGYLSQNKVPNKNLKRIDTVRNQMLVETARLLKKFGAGKNGKLYKLTMLAKDFAYLRTWRTDVIYRAGVRARHLYQEIGKRAGLTPDDVLHCSITEIIQMAKTGRSSASKSELKKRKEWFATVFYNNEYKIFAGKEWKKKFAFLPTASAEQGIISGVCAYPGKLKGTARIVHSGHDLDKVKRGDILVATMTFPNFIPAMEKAAAFVTDEGGILCHAAIISREMRKPCIIATKNATQVLKDGDMVEVDANNGIVKKI